VNIVWQKSFARVDTTLKAIAERGWGPLNYVLLDRPELQETNDRVQSINEIYEKQVMDGVEITDLTLLNTDKGSMGLTMDMFLDNELQERALGKLTAAKKGKSVPSWNVEEGGRRSALWWPHVHHIWICHWSRLPHVVSPYSAGQGEKGKRDKQQRSKNKLS
jgi:hypothetical protein